MSTTKPKPHKPPDADTLRYAARQLRIELRRWGYSIETSEELFILSRRFEREARAAGKRQ